MDAFDARSGERTIGRSLELGLLRTDAIINGRVGLRCEFWHYLCIIGNRHCYLKTLHNINAPSRNRIDTNRLEDERSFNFVYFLRDKQKST